jgi:hypothetical protein
MYRAKPGMALVLAFLLPVAVGCARRNEAGSHSPAAPATAASTPDLFSQFLADFLEEETPPPGTETAAEPVPDVSALPPLPRDYLPPDPHRTPPTE